MKKILTVLCAIALISFFTTPALAGGCTVKYPKDCEIMGSEYSTGGGKKMIVYLEVDCKKPDGRYIKYIDSETSASGFLGFGRFTIPSKFVFEKWDRDEIDMQGC